MIGRLQQAGDFRRLLDAPVRQRSAHFAVHYVRAKPAAASPAQARRDSRGEQAKLSTGDELNCSKPVDDCPGRRWLGCLVPKRHARRAVTRSLLKRQMRSVVHAHEAGLSAGLWLIRLSRPFSPRDFSSAASQALRRAARLELERLVKSLAAPMPDQPRGSD